MPSKRFKLYVYTFLGIALLFLLARLLFVGNTFLTIRTALRPLGISFLIIYLLAPIVNRIEEKMRWPRLPCVLLTYLLILLLLSLLLYVVVPQLIANLLEVMPDSYEDFAERITTHPFLGRFLRRATLDQLFASFVGVSSADILPLLLRDSAPFLGSLADSLKELSLWGLALVMAFYGLLTTRSLGRSAADFLYPTIPTSWADRLLSLLYIIDRALRDFVLSKLLTCLILGLLVYLGILLVNLFFRLSIPYPLLQALITGLLNLVPYVGPLLGLLPCLLMALLEGWAEAVALLAVLLLMQQVDNLIVEPRILSRSAGIQPFWALSSVTCLGILFSPLAAVFAIPVASVCRTLLQQHQESYRLRREGLPDTVFLQRVPLSWQKKRIGSSLSAKKSPPTSKSESS